MTEEDYEEFLGFWANVGGFFAAMWAGVCLFVPRFYGRLCGHVDAVLTTGWRKLWGWLGLAVGAFSFLYAPLNHIAIDGTSVNVFLAFCTAQYFGRGAEKLISIGALQIPGLSPQPPEGGPRPMQPA